MTFFEFHCFNLKWYHGFLGNNGLVKRKPHLPGAAWADCAGHDSCTGDGVGGIYSFLPCTFAKVNGPKKLTAFLMTEFHHLNMHKIVSLLLELIIAMTFHADYFLECLHSQLDDIY